MGVSNWLITTEETGQFSTGISLNVHLCRWNCYSGPWFWKPFINNFVLESRREVHIKIWLKSFNSQDQQYYHRLHNQWENFSAPHKKSKVDVYKSKGALSVKSVDPKSQAKNRSNFEVESDLLLSDHQRNIRLFFRKMVVLESGQIIQVEIKSSYFSNTIVDLKITK